MKNPRKTDLKINPGSILPKTAKFSNSFLLLATLALAKVARSFLLSPLSFFPFLITFLLSPFSSFSQAPVIEWQKSFGGTQKDYLKCAKQTTDGGFILGGNSESGISGNKTETNSGTQDYWIVKLNSLGIVEWQNDLGGSAWDNFAGLDQTADGGFILIGDSKSGISGDKTEALIGGGFSDYWVIKLNSTGAIEWQNAIGGSNFDYGKSIQQTPDGGYIVGGKSSSSISGDKTESSHGGSDYWVLKLNASGAIEWQNTIGGNGNDDFQSLQLTSDGGYILAGYSVSGISGDKSEACFGEDDYWVVKINSSGIVEWENTIGGADNDQLYSVCQTLDGGYLLGGYSESNISTDKSQPCFGEFDYWVIKLNSTGVIEWEKTIGGSSFDQLRNVHQDSDGGYLLGGFSESGISGFKTEPAIGVNDYWILKLNNIGDISWQNTIGGASTDELYTLSNTSDAGFIIGGLSWSGINGDKTEPQYGSGDFWFIKLSSGGCSPTPEVCNGFDDDCNGIADDGATPSVAIEADGYTSFCPGESLTLTAFYTGTSLQWRRNGNIIAGATSSTYMAIKSGVYTCETSDACGTSISNEITITTYKLPKAIITSDGATTFCTGGSVVLTANAGGGLSYQWYKGASPIAGATSINYTATLAGNYKCKVTKFATDCSKNSNIISVSVPCKESMETLNSEINIYPNPVTDKINISIDYKFEIGSFIITSISGETIMQEQLISGISEFEISKLMSGFYFITFKIDGKTTTQKLIKQ